MRAEPARSVLIVLEATFPRRGGGGAESQVLAIGQCLAERGVAVQVVAPMVADGRQVARESVEGVDVVRIPYPKIKFLGSAVMLARLAALLVARRAGYSVIHAHIGHNMASVCAVVGRLLGKPVAVKLTGMHEMRGGILDPRPGIASRLRRRAIRTATVIQATSTRIGALLAERGFDAARIRLLPNGVDVRRFTTASRDAALCGELRGDAARVGIFVGRLVPEKGQDLLIEAWARACGARPDMRLVLVGDGPERAPLAALAARLGLADRVVFAGHRDRVEACLACADFAILPSLAEGLSNALLEYMAAGLPVVGSRVSGTEDFVVEGETGWLFEPGSAAELERRLSQAAALGEAALRRMGDNARDRILASASLEAVTAELIRCYGFAAADPGRPREPIEGTR